MKTRSFCIQTHILSLNGGALGLLHGDSFEAEVESGARHLLVYLHSLVDSLEFAGVHVLLFLLGSAGVVHDHLGQVVQHLLHQSRGHVLR